jgi:hypothetical protein
MSIVLLGLTSGSCTLQEQAVAGTSVLTLPVGTGTVVANNVNSAIVSGTAVASTSGTSIDFTGIPSWVKRVTVMLNGVSTNGASVIQVQLGDSGGVETTGYNSTAGIVTGAYVGAAGGITATSGFIMEYSQQSASFLVSGHLVVTNISGNIWVASGVIGNSAAGTIFLFSGNKTLSDVLTQVRITTVNGTDTFDAGSINIFYE